MGKLRSVLKRVRLRYRRSSTLTKVVVMSAIVVCMVALLTLRAAIDTAEKRMDNAKDQAAQLEQDNGKLTDSIDKLGTAEGVEQIAKDELGMVPSGAVVITPED